jgi:hypothetical protein
MDIQKFSASPLSTPAKAASASRIPAVIGTEPWSWQGDDNTGNMIHAGAARRMISRYTEFRKQGAWSEADIEQLKVVNSHIVYVTANIIRLGVSSDHASIEALLASQVTLAKNIERAALPVVVFGLGSQAALNGPIEFTAPPQTVRLLKVISDHSQKVAVRGAFTAEACAKLGVKNVEVVGCQSMFWHRVPQFSWGLADRFPERADEIAFNFTDALSEADLINHAMANGYDMIGQQNDAEENLKAKGGSTLGGPFKFGCQNAAGFPVTANAGVGLAMERGLIDRAAYEDWIRGHFFQFRELEPWLSHMRHYRFSYGTRLHGNMAALIAGARGLWIVHDMRTKELCDHFGLPCVELREVRDGVDLKALYDRADYSLCACVYPDRYRTLFEYVDRAGLPHSLPAPIAASKASTDDARPAPWVSVSVELAAAH